MTYPRKKRTSKRRRQAELDFLGVNLDQPAKTAMTCLSCDAWSASGCLKARSGFPAVGPVCRAFSYEPGSDEQEID